MLRQAQHEPGEVVCGLQCHPATPSRGVNAIEVAIVDTVLTFTIDGATPRVPPPAAPRRRDGLWRTTCFEFFVRPEGSAAYFEFNFSPSTEWAAYRFADYRDGMVDLPIAPPTIEPVEHGIRVQLDLSALPPPPWRVGLSAVIEETDGTKSYWALAHPDGPPDFHDPACFALSVASATTP